MHGIVPVGEAMLKNIDPIQCCCTLDPSAERQRKEQRIRYSRRDPGAAIRIP
jgi:hypothetical protein